MRHGVSTVRYVVAHLVDDNVKVVVTQRYGIGRTESETRRKIAAVHGLP